MNNSQAEPPSDKNLRWNFTVNVLDNMLYALAISLVSRETIMPLLVSRLSDSPLAVGLIPALFSLCFLLPQLFVASHAEGLKRKLPFVLLFNGLLQRLPYPLIGLALLLFATSRPSLALAIFFLCIATAAFGGGIVTPAWFTMIGKVIPQKRRGLFFGLADGAGLLMGLIGAFFVSRILDTLPYPSSFSLLFLIASLPLALSWLALALTKEPPSQHTKPALPLRHYLRQLPTVLRHHEHFRRFLLSYAFLQMSMMSLSFFIVFADSHYDLTGHDIGLLNALFIGSQAVMRLAFGWLGDRWGHKRNLTLSAASFSLAPCFILLSSDSVAILPAFLCLACAVAADGVSRFNIVLEYANPTSQPTFIGLANTIITPITFAAPLLGGWLATAFNLRVMFAASLLCGIISAALLSRWTKDPRTIPNKEKP